MSWKYSLAKAMLRHEWLGRAAKSALRSRLLTHLPPYQWWMLRQAARRDAQLPRIKPWILIETTLTCNARCTMCLHAKLDMRGEMSLELYEKLIKEVADWGIATITLNIYGEPFVDRHWVRRIEIARAHGVEYSVVSNGSLLRPEVLRRMFELGGWNEVIFSVNGLSADAYERMMPPLKRDKVYANIDMFLEMRRKLGANRPTVKISCVVTSINAHERQDFVRHWRAVPGVSDVLMADCDSFLGAVDVTELTVNGSKRDVADGAWLAPCPWPWGQLAVLHDGRVLTCCEDHAARSLVVGDANVNTLQEIFHGEPLRKLRELHKSNRRCAHGVCGKCQVNTPWLA